MKLKSIVWSIGWACWQIGTDWRQRNGNQQPLPHPFKLANATPGKSK